MRGGTCHSISHLVVPFTLTHSFLEYHTECESAWHLSTQSLNAGPPPNEMVAETLAEYKAKGA